jgi:signal transduction histidine kinase
VAHRILTRESPGGIRTPIEKPGQPEFDARELRRWGVAESRLPPGSLVRFREAGVWERFRSIIIAAATVVLAQAALIGALLVNRVKRRRAEASLHEHVSTLSAARAALSNLSGRLLHAQEEERTRLARELHDDIGQRMAFLAIDLERLRQALPNNAAAALERADGMHDTVVALGLDIQGISHRLHSSKIEYLGLAAAAASFCREVSSRHALAVSFVHENVPATLAEGIAISLFRVLQEAVSNAVKHAGAQHCRVALRGTADALHLEVVDDGRGFDVDEARSGHGLGLISMQERLKLVNGDVAIESRAGSGTTVRARVPLQSPVTSGARA